MTAVLPLSDARSLFAAIRTRMHDGAMAGALDDLRVLETRCANDAILLQHVAEHFMFAQHNADAVRVYRRAVALRPDDPAGLYNLATALIAVGEAEEAEALLDRVIALKPDDYDAYQNRATLRKQTPERNHVAELEALIDRTLINGAPAGEVALGYALAKELEDLGLSARAFSYLKRAADRRRRALSYDVQGDIDAMAAIAESFDAGYLADGRVGCPSDAPIFVMGLPRSGTTLVDRIISSHDRVESLGEINDFALTLTRLARSAGGGKMNLIRAARDIDPGALGQAYIAAVRGYGVTTAHVIDKTPANYLYVGLILKALPKARIVHLRRDPMDNGYALYKTLFRMGCPYSYDLGDIGRYMLAHARLMEHWRTIAPDRIIDIDYEAVTADPDGETRGLIGALGLDWQESCLRFHENRSAAATASAVQVRQPIYRTSVALWQRYAGQLEPLRAVLSQGGLIASTGQGQYLGQSA